MRRRVVRVPQESTVRLELDDEYVRREFAEIRRGMPRELRRPDRRLFELYLIPDVEER